MSLQRVWELLTHVMSLYEGFDKVAIAAKSFKDILQGWEKWKPCVMVHMPDPDPWGPFTINNLKMEEGDYHDLSNSKPAIPIIRSNASD